MSRKARAYSPLRGLRFGWLALCLMCYVLHTTKSIAQINTEEVTFMGRAAIGADDYLTAIRYFNQVIEAKPFLHEPYYFRAYSKFSLGDYKGAEEDCSRSIERNPYISSVFSLRGLCRIHLSNFEGAVEDYGVTLRDNPDDAGVRFNRGLCYMELKQYDKAENDMADLLRRHSGYLRAYQVKAQIALLRGDTLGAEERLDTLLQMREDDADAWAFKGRLAYEQKEYARADSFLTRAVTLRSSNFEDLLVRALTRHALHRFGDAIADYDRVVDIIPEHFVAHYNRGLLLALVGEDNRAIKDFDFILTKEPDNTLARYNRAMLRTATGNYQGAIADYTHLIQLYPNFIAGYAARAELYRKTGNKRGATSDETVVSRYGLDLTYGKQRKRSFNKVRTESEHSLDRYDQLVTDENDSTSSVFERLFARDLFGRVQNINTPRRLLPMFALTTKAPPADAKGYRSIGFMPEVAALVRRTGRKDIHLSAETVANGDTLSLAPVSTNVNEKDTFAASLLLQAVEAMDLYDYTPAEEATQKALGQPIDNGLRILLFLQQSVAATRRAQIESGEVRSAAYHIAAEALAKALSLAPQNAYLHYNLACLKATTGDAAGAIAELDIAIKLDPKMAEAYFNRGILKLENGHQSAAQSDFSRAGELGLYKAYNLLKQIQSSEKEAQ